MTDLTAERIAELRSLSLTLRSLNGDDYTRALYRLNGAVPALLDAAEENVRLRKALWQIEGRDSYIDATVPERPVVRGLLAQIAHAALEAKP